MLLADALSYAQQYDPELVIDLATLTGAAARAVGKQGVVFMGNTDTEEKAKLQSSGEHVHERLIEFPLWEEYNKMLESDIADIKNIGGAAAGAITAGMFLQYFTKYPWMHIDIASMAFFDSPDAYRLKNGTGVGARLIFDYLSKRAESNEA
jgi:leucyl aminopeptidase